MTDGGVSISPQTGEPGGQKKCWRHHIAAWQGSGLSQSRVDVVHDIAEVVL